MSENHEKDMLAGIEFGEPGTLLDLHVQRRKIATQFGEDVMSASDAYNENCSTSTLSAYTQAARDSAESLDQIVAESVQKILFSVDGYAHELKLQEVAQILCEDYFLRMNIYRQALGLEQVEITNDDLSDKLSMVSASQGDSIEDTYEHIIIIHQADLEPDFPAFVTSLVLGEVDYWNYAEDFDEGNG